MIDAGEIHRNPLPGGCAAGFLAVSLKAANADLFSDRHQLQLTAFGESSAGERAGHHCSKPLDDDAAVDWQSGDLIAAPRAYVLCRGLDRPPQLIEPFTGRGTDRDDLCF